MKATRILWTVGVLLACTLMPARAQQPCVDLLAAAIEGFRGDVAEEAFTADLQTRREVKQLSGTIRYGTSDDVTLKNESDREELTLQVRDGAIARGRFVDNFGEARRVNTRRPDEVLVGLIRYEDAASMSWNGPYEDLFAFDECRTDGDTWTVKLTPRPGWATPYAYQVISGTGAVVEARAYYTRRGLDRRIRYDHRTVGDVWRPARITIEQYRGDRVVRSNVLSNIVYDIR